MNNKHGLLSEHLQFCKSDQEKMVITLLINGETSRSTAKSLDLSKTTVLRTKERVKDRASLQGFSPENDMDKTAPDTHFVKGTSTLYKDGEKVLQWVKTDKKVEDQYASLNAAALALKEDITPRKPNKKTKDLLNSDLINCYTITDYHFGMLAWGEETGADWDLDTAESTLVDWFAAAIEQSPKSETAIFANIGDMLHWDGMEAKTPSHGHILDADTRFQKLVRTAIRTMVRVVDMLLEKHDKVHFLNATGNHDLASSVWLRELFSMYYSKEPRVTVDDSADVYYCYEFGDTSIFWHHGHKRGVGNVSAVFAAKFREVFGRTKFSYGHLGHRHSVDVKENNLMIIEQHQTLAAPDAHSSGGGWMSSRSAQVITYHKNYGEVGRIRITPEMIG